MEEEECDERGRGMVPECQVYNKLHGIKCDRKEARQWQGREQEEIGAGEAWQENCRA